MKQLLDKLAARAQVHEKLLLASGLVLAVLVRFIRIGSWSIWFDESFTSALIRQDVATGVAITAKDVHPPLYYLLLKGWTVLFGSGDIALRSFSALLSVLAALLVYLFIRKRFTSLAALAAFLAVALGPFGVRYAQEARMYALVTVFVVIATWSFIRLIEEKRPKPWLAVTYSLSIAAALYTHYFVFPIVGAHIIYAYIYHFHGWLPRPSAIRAFLNEKRRWLYALLLSGVLYAPWVPTAIKQFSNVANGFWIPKVTIMAPFHTFFFFLTNTSPERISFDHSTTAGNFATVVVACYLAVLAILAVAAYRLAPVVQKRVMGLLALTSLVPIAVIFMLSVEPFQSLYIDRYFIYFGVMWYALVGIILVARLPAALAWLRGPMIAATLACFAFGLTYLYRLGNFNYNTWQTYGSKDVMAYVNTHYHSGDLILSNDIFTFYDALHYNHTDSPVLADTTKDGTSSTPYLRQFPKLLVEDRASITAPRVWYITLSGDQPAVPANWHAVGEPFVSNHAKATLYDLQ